MKRVAALFGKKFLRNAVIALAIVAVAYAVMYGVKEGFQSKETAYYINVYDPSTKGITIPNSELKGKGKLSSIKFLPYAGVMSDMKVKLQGDKYVDIIPTNNTGDKLKEFIDRAAVGQFNMKIISGKVSKNLKGNNPTRFAASSDIKIGDPAVNNMINNGGYITISGFDSSTFNIGTQSFPNLDTAKKDGPPQEVKGVQLPSNGKGSSEYPMANLKVQLNFT